ncbi:MAG: nickel-dependent hydrogenase large subunit [Acidimicrobiaceae bacterium]|nr:nickel-dependent hydrogenase large subunit [Acidimicrobiaceae bacterium]
MCFKNLPIEFDDAGKARLVEGIPDPYAVAVAEPRDFVRSALDRRSAGALAAPPRLREWSIDPVTRVAGALAVHTVLDLETRTAVEAHSMAMLFRGYEIILKGRDPRDAIDISSRACGVCGGVHASVSSLAIEMAFGIQPPPLGACVRNLGEVAEMFYDHPLHLGLLAGPDYSTAIVSVTNPELVDRASKTLAPHADVHGYVTIKDIMDALNPLEGSIYLESLEYTRIARKMCTLMYGKYPHPSTLVPGGVSTTVSTTTFNEYYANLGLIFDYAKRLAGIWDDICDFFLEANPAYSDVGLRPSNLIQTGIWDDVEVYDATYANIDAWGQARYSAPGIIKDGELLTTKLTEINMGIEEFVEHSYYEDWTTNGNGSGNGHVPFPTDALGNPLSPYHAWNKETIPRPEGKNFKEKYSWATAPRWDRTSMETGVYGRMWTTAMAQQLPDNPYIEATGDGLRMLLPAHDLPETELFWRVPAKLNAFERNRGRAYGVAFTAAIGMICLMQAFEYWRKGETRVSTPFKVPRDERVSAGFWEAGRGYLTHHMHMDKGRLLNYQINTPSTWNASPRDPFGSPGPYEQAIMGTPILESVGDDDIKGIDILRTIRSFDPCMPCTTHMDTGRGVITREVNSCGCTLE